MRAASRAARKLPLESPVYTETVGARVGLRVRAAPAGRSKEKFLVPARHRRVVVTNTTINLDASPRAPRKTR